MMARTPGRILPLALVLSAACAGLAAADPGAGLSVTLVQAPGRSADPTFAPPPFRSQFDAPGSRDCPAGTDENICATLRRPLPSSVPRSGGVITYDRRPDLELGKGLTDQQTLRGMSLGR